MEIVDSQFDAAATNDISPADRVLAVYRLVEFLRRDARLSGVIEDAHTDAAVQLAAFQEHDRDTRAALRAVWERYRGDLEAARRAAGEREAAVDGKFGKLEDLGKLPDKAADIRFDDDNVTKRDPSELDEAFSRFFHWFDEDGWTRAADNGATDSPAWRQDLGKELRKLREKHREAWAGFQLADRTLAGPAFDRLAHLARWVNPPLAIEGDSEWPKAFMVSRRHREGRLQLFGENSEKGTKELDTLAVNARRDLGILHLDLRTRILIGRSRLSLVKRFAGRCERYDAPQLRRLAATPRRSEAELTLVFARYLYDHGLTPFVDASVAGLRPDIFDPADSVPVYVEAKAYNNGNPTTMIRKAVWQVFDTWGRLENTKAIAEAFLVIFRVGGSLAILPPVVRVRERRLFLRVVDIAEPKRAGSRQQDRTVTLTEEDLGPRHGDGRTGASAPKRRSGHLR
jgi:hypothetical protein